MEKLDRFEIKGYCIQMFLSSLAVLVCEFSQRERLNEYSSVEDR